MLIVVGVVGDVDIGGVVGVVDDVVGVVGVGVGVDVSVAGVGVGGDGVS